MPRAALRLIVRLALAGLCLGCVACSRDAGFGPPVDAVRLPIPDRAWAPGAPPVSVQVGPEQGAALDVEVRVEGLAPGAPTACAIAVWTVACTFPG